MTSPISYDEIADTYNQKFKTPSEYLDIFMHYLKKGTVLDIGCGTGVDAQHLIEHGFSVTGIDISEKMLIHAKKNAPKGNFILGDIKIIDLQKKFEGVLAAYSLFHFPKKEVPVVLQKIKNTLKTDGFLYVAIQEGESKELLIDEPLKPGSKMFLNIMSKNELHDLLKKYGFSILREFERKETKPGEFNFTKLFVIAQRD